MFFFVSEQADFVIWRAVAPESLSEGAPPNFVSFSFYTRSKYIFFPTGHNYGGVSEHDEKTSREVGELDIFFIFTSEVLALILINFCVFCFYLGSFSGNTWQLEDVTECNSHEPPLPQSSTSTADLGRECGH